MSYKFTKEELKELLVDYNEIALKDYDLPEKVCIWDETLRDGEQSPTVYLTLDEKIHLAKLMDEIGVKIIAVGFPAVSETEKNIVKTIVNEDCKNATIVGIARPKKEDIDACIDADLEEIVIFMPVSPIFMKTLHLTEEDELNQIASALNYARDNGFEVNWVSEDGTRAEYDHLKNVFKTALKTGAKRVIIGDTVGVLTPQSTGHLIKNLRKDLESELKREVPMGIHTHNDFGLAVANTISGVFEGCKYPHTCVNGYGERAGNAALEEVATILERMGVNTGINLKKLPELCEVCEKYFSQPLSLTKPIVGEFAFSHESGLHIAAILAHPLTYEPINPKMVGRRRKFYLGKFSGSKSIQQKLKVLDEDLLNIPDEVIQDIVKEVKTQRETKSKEEIRCAFNNIKKELDNLSQGLSDREFFDIVYKHAKPYVPDDFKKKKPKQEQSDKSC
ncbi:MAG: 2-isopropylmalate synthase [Promethearchaeota archaeon]|nr:MAG: 2-isopropylmalate synthase [Candidatus Lokiarchaeota archaeon]